MTLIHHLICFGMQKNSLMSTIMIMMTMLMNPCGEMRTGQKEHEKAEDYVSIYAHILSTPVSGPFVSFCLYIAVRSVNDLELFFTFFLQVIADIDKDGVHEMVIAL